MKQSRKVWRTCPGCGREYFHWASRFVAHCSHACRSKGKKAIAVCPGCGKEFSYHKSWPRKYCSDACKGKGCVGNITHFAATAYAATCQQCGVTYKATPARTKGRFCSLACFGAWQSEHVRGEAHPGWRGGYEPYYGASWRSAQRSARRRDRVCQDCGRTREEEGRELTVHHLRAFRDFGRDRHPEANDLANLLTLCGSCHSRRERQIGRDLRAG